MSGDEKTPPAFITAARGFLRDEYLPKIERCLELLSDEQIWWRPNEDSNSVGNLLLHLCGNARQWIVSGLGGAEDDRVRQSEFDERRVISRDELLTRTKATLSQVDATLAQFDESRLLETFEIQGTTVTALAAIFHVTEHFSMHTGQIILLTKLLTASDLHFYDFDGGAPVHRWGSHPARSS
ncbi:MAG TPA: DinB family protein [Pyrinomonadaceae bacterium]|nr:DinB family protein [Pyrinomonadaceae bacterium]